MVTERAPLLTPQQARVLRLALEGMTVPQIADALDLRPATVKHHLYDIRTRTGQTGRGWRLRIQRALFLAEYNGRTS